MPCLKDEHGDSLWIDEEDGLIWWQCKKCGDMYTTYNDCTGGR